MARSLDGIEAQVRESTTSGFHHELLARGQARAMIWRDGELPDDAPKFTPLLTYELLSYGYTLLNLSIAILERSGDAVLARKGFENAASAIESAIAKNDKGDSSWAFHMLMAASAYHLGRFSARAYSLIAPMLEGANLSSVERCIALLMVRNLDGLDAEVRAWRQTRRGTDEDLIARFNQDANPVAEDGEEEDAPPIFDAVRDAIADNFVDGIATFLLALERGDNRLVDEAIRLLTHGMGVCADTNFVPLWWDHRTAIYLISDLWATSYWVRLPHAPQGQTGGDEWSRLRALLIALLLRRGKAEIELWPSQLDGASRAVNLDDDLVVSLPTSAGKTRIAELAILRCLSAKKRVIFATPLRALSAQTEVILQRTFGPLGQSISSLYGSIGTSGMDDNALRERDIVVATPEKLDFALRNDPSLLDDVGLIVLDEGHMIGLGEREVRYEAQIQRLLRRTDAAERRIVCLSAILPEGEQLDDFVNWLTSDRPEGAIKSDWRPTRLRFGEIVPEGGNFRLDLKVGDETPWIKNFIEPKLAQKPSRRRKPFPDDQRELCLAAAWKLIGEGQSVLIFCPERRSVEPFAKEIVALAKHKLLSSVLIGDEALLKNALQIGEEWLGRDHSILQCLRLGVAIHHGALPTPFRKEVERLLRDGVLKVTVSSPTLAQGLNLSASTLIFFGIKRGRDLIAIEDFKNIIGRAGRAYVDVEGLILLPMFDDVASQQANWKALCDNIKGRQMQSGLFRLVFTLITRMVKSLGGDTKKLIDYVTNNTEIWSFPKVPFESAQTTQVEAENWDRYMTSLDTAILSLIGEEDIPVADLAARLDAVLSSSLWARSLARQPNKKLQNFITLTLKKRATYIWNKSTPAGRRGYFLAGVGLDTGLQLDAIAQQAAELLISVNGAILNKDEDAAIKAFIAFAELILPISPFTPDDVPDNWKDVITAWLKGEPLATVGAGQEDDVLLFVEGTLIYRLPWGMEAVRVRGLAVNDYQDDAGLSLSDYTLNLAMPVLETGTLNIAAAMLMQAGFSSRLAAIKVIKDTEADFDTASGLRRWLRSKEIDALSADPAWPTPETADMWKTFRESFRRTATKTWHHQVYTFGLDGAHTVTDRTALRMAPGDGCALYDAAYNQVGKLAKPVSAERAGLLMVTAELPNVRLDYYGPDDLTDEDEDELARLLG